MIIRNGNVVLKNSVEKKDLLIENGKIVKIADYIPANGSEEIDVQHISRAIQFRSLDRKFWGR